VIQQQTGAALMLITHDLGVIAEMVDNAIVMYAGQVVEQGTVDQVLMEPRMPYTMGLIESIPTVEKRGGRLSAIQGVVPSPFHLPPHCRFEPRCPYRWETCRTVTPELYPTGEAGRLTRCHLHLAEATARRDAAIASHEENLRLGRRLVGAPDRMGDA
jgi:oligopeptide/dipeptide ABC transporter ATP-binding protein